MNFQCSKCNTIFYNYEECLKHEECCDEKQKCPLKYIVLSNDDSINEFYIYEHPNALHKGNNCYILSQKHRYYEDTIFEDKLNTIKENDNFDFYICTDNFDESYEKECINKLINYKRQLLIDNYNKLGEKINSIFKNYSVERKII